MTVQFKSRQRGISFIGLVFVGSVIAMAGVVAAQVFPTIVEYQAITKAANKAAREGNSVVEIRTIFERALTVRRSVSAESYWGTFFGVSQPSYAIPANARDCSG